MRAADTRALSWDEARPAIRLGHAAARRFPDRAWDDELRDLLHTEWEVMKTSVDWLDARDFVRHGFRIARRDAAVAPTP